MRTEDCSRPNSEAARNVLLASAGDFEGRSVLYAALCRRLADDPCVGQLVDDWTWDAPLRLLGGLHYLVLSGVLEWSQAIEGMDEHREFLKEFVRTHMVQTNEAQRSWVLMPCFAALADLFDASSVHMIELGASAGLNLCWDAFAANYVQEAVGPDDAAVRLRGIERREVPRSILRLVPEVESRIGIDLHPLDAASPHDLRLLKSFIWPGQPSRVELLEAAASVVASLRPEVKCGDVVDVLPELMKVRDQGTLTVVFETATLGYVDRTANLNLLATLDKAGREGNLAFLSAKPYRECGSLSYEMSATVWPSGRRLTIAIADIHGGWIDWLYPV